MSFISFFNLFSFSDFTFLAGGYFFGEVKVAEQGGTSFLVSRAPYTRVGID